MEGKGSTENSFWKLIVISEINKSEEVTRYFQFFTPGGRGFCSLKTCRTEENLFSYILDNAWVSFVRCKKHSLLRSILMVSWKTSIMSNLFFITIFKSHIFSFLSFYYFSSPPPLPRLQPVNVVLDANFLKMITYSSSVIFMVPMPKILTLVTSMFSPICLFPCLIVTFGIVSGFRLGMFSVSFPAAAKQINIKPCFMSPKYLRGYKWRQLS